MARSRVMQQLLARAATVACTDASVVLLGESGTGKELMARSIHAGSPRHAQPFVAVNCAALPPELLESELFGHARGAFTGATAARHGLFEAAHGGTLFLDEVVELPLALQAKLLRALQDGEIRRIGESRPFTVDVRIICATNQDLRRAVGDLRFRVDLYFRLKVFTLRMPPLRERREDIAPLAQAFLEQEEHPTRRFTALAMAAFERYDWPGNVRELQSAVKHGAVLSQGGDVDVAHLPEELLPLAALRAGAPEPLLSLAEAEREHILLVLEACAHHAPQAARVLRISRSTLWRKLKAYGLPERH